MPSHEHFEELAALSVIGELSGEEFTGLQLHLAECEQCSKTAAQFAHIVQEQLPLSAPEHISWRDRLGLLVRRNGVRERFLSRALAEGFRFSPDIECSSSQQRREPAAAGGVPFRYALPVFVVLLVALTLVTLELRKLQSSSTGGVLVSSQLSELLQEKRRLDVDLRNQVRRIADLEAALAEAQRNTDSASKAANAMTRDRNQQAAASQRLEAALQVASARQAELQNQFLERERRMAELGLQLERISNSHAADAVVIASQQRQLEDLKRDLAAQKEVFDREHELLAANRDIRDLMGARNLHIIDVFDTDTAGKNRRAYGRVFYTEGKSLIFYAFDLNGTKMRDAKHSFQAWAGRDGHDAAKSLGIFYADDTNQRRWVLKFDDPTILAQIDSVFVTVEPFGGAQRPSGQKLLYAYLKNTPNHP